MICVGFLTRRILHFCPASRLWWISPSLLSNEYCGLFTWWWSGQGMYLPCHPHWSLGMQVWWGLPLKPYTSSWYGVKLIHCVCLCVWMSSWPTTGNLDNICVVLYVSCRLSLTDGKEHVTSLRKLLTVDIWIFVFLSISF